MYIVYQLNDSIERFRYYSTAEATLLQQGFQEVFPEDLSAEQYRIYDMLQQTVDFGRGSDLVEFVSLFRSGRELKAIYEILED